MIAVKNSAPEIFLIHELSIRLKAIAPGYDPDLDDHFVSDYLDSLARRENFRDKTPGKQEPKF
jgi:hypothetical protein